MTWSSGLAALSALALSTPTSSVAVGASIAEARIESILAIVLEKNPSLDEARERTRAARERIASSSRLPDLEIKAEIWGAPLRRPWALDESDTLMIGARQTFPAAGSRDARERAAAAEAEASIEVEKVRVAELELTARRAYAEYYRADREYALHLEHVELANRTIDLLRANHRSGLATQADVLRATVELSRLHRDVAELERARDSAGAMLNVLMDRSPVDPLGAPPELDLSTRTASATELARPELRSAARAIQRSEAMLDVSRTEATWPSIMIGADYWYMPNADFHHGYGAMVTINVPWLNPQHQDAIREAERLISAERRALANAANNVRYEVRDASLRVNASRRTLAIIEERLVPDAERSFEATRSAFASGQSSALAVLEALQMLIEVRIEHLHARSEVFIALAELDRARGSSWKGAGDE